MLDRVAVTEVEADHVDAGAQHLGEQLGRLAGRAEGRHDLGT